jgi:hypothetical protein
VLGNFRSGEKGKLLFQQQQPQPSLKGKIFKHASSQHAFTALIGLIKL